MLYKAAREQDRDAAAVRLQPGRPALVFTDLDGTLLDHDTYRPDAALPWLRALERLGVPIVMVTSKTFDEVLGYQRLLARPQPVIVENGGAIGLPEGFADAELADENREGYLIQRFPPGQQAIVATVERIRGELGVAFDSFDERNAEWVARVTGLGLVEAEAARRRCNSLPLLWRDSDAKLARFRDALARAGLRIERGGRFLHVQGAVDKSFAMQRLVVLFESRGLANPQVVALGDSPNDKNMLEAADIAVVVRRPDGSHLRLNRRGPVILTREIGPAGWAEAVRTLLARKGKTEIPEGVDV